MSDDKAAAAAATAAATPAAAPAPAPDPAIRPDYVPEKFWNAETKGIRVKELAGSYNELASKFSMSRDAVRTELENERNQQIAQKRPADPGGYKIAFTPAFSEENLKDIPLVVGEEQPKDPTKPYVRLDNDNPVMAWWRKTAHAQGLDQNQFQEGVETFVAWQMGQSKKGLAAAQTALAAEKAKLGERGDARIADVDRWAKANMTEAEYNLARQIASTALGVGFLEKMMGVKTLPATGGNQPPAGDSDPRKMMLDPRYWNPMKRDKAYVAQVDAAFKRLYPGSSQVS